MKTPTFHRIKGLAFLLSATLLVSCGSYQIPQDPRVLEMAKAGKAYFEEKCRTVAGEKIYRTVPDVEGVLLMKVRPARSQTELEDPMWPGAAFAIESYEDSYIKSFLGYEHAAGRPDGRAGVITKEHRGYIDSDKRPGGRPGYRFVDVMDAKDGQRVRVNGIWRVTGKKDTTAYNVKVELDKNPNYCLLYTSPSPRD